MAVKFQFINLAAVENLSTHPTVEHLLDVGHLVVVGQAGGVVERPGTQLALVSGGLLRRLGQGVLLQNKIVPITVTTRNFRSKDTYQ